VALSGYLFRRGEKAASDDAAGPCTIVAGEIAAAEAEEALARARAHAAGIALARDLTNAPAAEAGPAELADAALELARRHGFTAECWRGADVERRGFRMVAAVGRASARPPTVTVLARGLDAGEPAVALIGKG